MKVKKQNKTNGDQLDTSTAGRKTNVKGRFYVIYVTLIIYTLDFLK